MIAIKPRHLALTATLPTIFIIQATLSSPSHAPCKQQLDTRPTISAIDSPHVDRVMVPLDDEILEEGSASVVVHESFAPKRFEQPVKRHKAGEFAWRWRWKKTPDFKANQSASLKDGKLELVKFHNERGTRGAERIPALERRDNDGKLVWSFLPRETANRAKSARAPVSAQVLRHGDVAYVIYHTTGLVTGCEVYAVELETGLPIWRELLEDFDRHGWYTNNVQAEIKDGVLDVHIFSDAVLSGYRLDAARGEILERRDVTMMGALTRLQADYAEGLELRRIVVADGHYLGLERPHRKQGEGVQITRRDSQDNSRWRLTMSGDVLRVFQDKDTPDILQILTYDEKAGGALVTAIDIDHGEILWANQLEGIGKNGGRLRERELHTFVGSYRGVDGELHEVLLVQGSEIREHGTEARDYSFVEALDPRTGRTHFNVQFLP